jgi:site-specific DNA-methyltransferase (adenine-specific)
MSQDLRRVIHGKSEEVIPTLDDDSIHLVVTSPPYNVDLGNNKYNKTPYDLYNDNRDHHEYIAWLRDEIFGPLMPKLVSGGRVVINIGDPKNGRVPSHVDICHFMTADLGYLPFTNIIWRKSQIANRTSWGSYMSPSCPSFPTPFEHILIFAKDAIKLQTNGETNLTPKEFQDWAIAEWTFAPEQRMKQIGHPAMFPVELPRRCIKMLSWIHDVVLDPFCGAGTTGVACKELNRRFIGIEMSEAYVEIAEKRLYEANLDFEDDCTLCGIFQGD